MQIIDSHYNSQRGESSKWLFTLLGPFGDEGRILCGGREKLSSIKI